MDLHLRCVAAHPKGGKGGLATSFAFSSRHARLVTAASDILIDQSTSSNALRAVIRLSAPIEKLVYVGGSGAFLAFLENGAVASFAESVSGLRLVEERPIGGAERSVTLAEGAKMGNFALFAKAESPSLWCLPVGEGGLLGEPYKLRSDIEGEQENVNFVGGMFAKVRGKVATKPKARTCPIAAVASHPTLSFVAAAYTNGIARVWDIGRKQQRSHFDVQLLMGEKIVSLAMHPTMPIIVICTTQGRILSFSIKSTLYKHGDEPALAISKTRDRKRRFRAICFLPGSPSYLLLLTASRRILVRMIDRSGMIVNSSRFAKASRPLSTSQSAVLATAQAAVLDDIAETPAHDAWQANLLCEPAFGLIATTLDTTGNVYIFQPRKDGLPGIRRPLTSGLDTAFSQAQGNAFKGPVLVDAETLIVQRGAMFSYQLGLEQAVQVCTLPPGDAQRVEVAKDEYGYCIAALVFYYGDDEVTPSNTYAESEPSARYVLCTKQGEAGTWTASEPAEGRSGCFLGAPGKHDRILILSSSGAMVSIVSFAGSPKREGTVPARHSRGVQRFKFDGRQATKVFRAPFSSWASVLYHEADAKQLCISSNTFRSYDSENVSDEFSMDDTTAFALREKEVVIDVRWQRLPSRPDDELYLGAIMTDKRIYFVRDVLSALTVFEFQRVDRTVVPFAPPSFSWVGPSVMVLFGSALLSVTLEGRSDLIAGVSHGDNVTALVATLPDRIVYARPSPANTLNAISIASRPYSGMSSLVRGILALPTSSSRSNTRLVEKLRVILEGQDVSQGSSELTKTLIANGFSSIAYLLAVSGQGRFCMPPLRRAGFLGRMGDIRGALAITESEYAKLPDSDAFHEGTELYRLLQRILNLAFATGDFGVGRRCSALLGRKGTFSAFVDVEGGYAAIRSIAEFARANGHDNIVETLRPLIMKSANSSIAIDCSMIPTRSELDNIRRAVHSVDLSNIPLGSTDKSQMFINIAPKSDAEGNPVDGSQTELACVMPALINDRLEMFPQEVAVDLTAADIGAYHETSEEIGTIDMNLLNESGTDQGAPTSENARAGGRAMDSSDEEDLFNTAGDNSRQAPQGEIDEETKKYAEETRGMIQQQKEQLTTMLQQTSAETHALILAQRKADPTGRAVPSVRAAELRDRGLVKLEEGRGSSARKDFDAALRAIQRGLQRGLDSPAELTHELVNYKVLVKIRGALDEIRSSPHASTAAGSLTYAKLATAGTTLNLQARHQVETLIAATDANIVVGNFGMAARFMQRIKELGVPDEDVRMQLRDKYNACSVRGFADSSPFTVPSICYESLKVFAHGMRELRCNVCPARYLTDVGISNREKCPSCTLGIVNLR